MARRGYLILSLIHPFDCAALVGLVSGIEVDRIHHASKKLYVALLVGELYA